MNLFPSNFLPLACSPMAELTQILGGPLWFYQSAGLILSAILLKSLTFAWLEKSHQAFWLMLAGNVASSMVIGLSFPFTATPDLGFIFLLLIIFGITSVPAQRLLEINGYQERWWFNRATVALFVVGLYILSVITFAAAYGNLERGAIGWYWGFKVVAMIGSLTISLFISIFYEEWVISSCSDPPTVNPIRLDRVVKANLITMGLILTVLAVNILPQRFGYSFVLVKLMQYPQSNVSESAQDLYKR
ncbi:MAG: hypothetical protein HY774_24640 [Acidobacteria bacterium]|nr:hypothetical protein [Acidobacteriota bacterium]